MRSIWFAIGSSIVVAAIDQWLFYKSVNELHIWTADLPPLMVFQFLVLSSGLFIAIRTISSESTRSHTIRLILASSLLFAFWLPLGFDITDEGRRMSYSYFFMDSYRYHLVNFKFGSHLTTYLWLHLISIPSVLWMRVGFLFCKVAYVVVIFKILKQYFNARHAFLGVLIGAIVSIIFVDQVLDYNNIPSLFVLISVLCIEKASQQHRNVQRAMLIFAGVLLTFGVLSKFPVVSTLPILLIYIVYKNIAATANLKLRFIGLFFSGFISTFLVFIIILWANDLVGVYFKKVHTVIIEPFLFGVKNEAVSKLAEHGHDPASIGSKYLSQINHVLDRLWIYLLGFLPVVLLWNSNQKWKVHTAWLISAIVIILSFEPDNWVIEFISITLILYTVAIKASVNKIQKFTVLPLSLFLIIGLFIGTNNGLINLYMTGGLALLISVSVSAISYFGRNHIIGVSFVALLIAFLGWNTKSNTIYRNLDRPYLTSAFQSSAMRGLYSTQNRVALMDTTVESFNQAIQQDSNASLLCVNTVPGFNYLLGIKHSDYLFWRLGGSSRTEKLREFNAKTKPKYLIIANIDARLRYWPSYSNHPYSPNDSADFSFYKSYLQSDTSPYIELYSNQGFELWSKK